MNNMIGQRIGPYVITEKIGEGGMGVVYKGFQQTLNRYVAIKVLRTELAQDRQFVERFRREALAVAELSHPNILHVYDAGFFQGMYYLVMAYADGGSLKDRIARGPLEIEDAISITAQVADALQHAHQRGLVHRDVKPSNILMHGDGRPLLCDFGIAKALGETTGLTGTGISMGTPAYMAPEQIQGQRVDGRTDIYALGIVLYEMLVGWTPFAAATPTAVMYRQVNDPPPPLRKVNVGIPAWLEAVAGKTLAKSPGERYQQASELATALRQQRAPGRIATPPAPPVQPAKPRRRGLSVWFWALAGMAVAMLVFVVIAIVLAIGGPGGGSTREPSTDVVAIVTATPSPQHTAVTIVTATPSPQSSEAAGGDATPETLAPTSAPSAGESRVRSIDNMEMVYVPAGEFLMGSASEDPGLIEDEEPQHVVYLDGYWIDRTEVTNGQFRLCVEAGVCQAPTACDWGEPTYEDAGMADHPVICVSWKTAGTYCQWAGGRLPTEAEWEKAARGTEGQVYPWGNTFDSSRLNFCDRNCEYDGADAEANDGYARTAPVGSYPAGGSPYGALDMAGNVWEWVSDWYDGSYYSYSPERSPFGPFSGEEKVLRGGAWAAIPRYVRGAFRHVAAPGDLIDAFGFRCVSEQPPEGP